MNRNQEQFQELRGLIDAMCENTITQHQTVRLEELIASDETAMEFYIQSIWMNDSLGRLSSGMNSRIDASQFEKDSQNPESLISEESDIVSTFSVQHTGTQHVSRFASEPPRHKNATADGNAKKRFFFAVAATIILLMGFATLWWINSGSGDPIVENPIDTGLNGFCQAIRQEARPFVPFNVESERLQRQELTDGTIVIVRPGTKYNIGATREVALEKGELFLIVAKSDQPFVVKTVDGEVLATGTRFTVSAGDATRAAVAQGNIVMKSTSGSIELGAGQQGTLAQSEKPTRGPAHRLSYLVNWARDALKQDELLLKPVDGENGLIAIDPYGQEARLTLRRFKVDVYIEDGVARTTIDQTFFNHNPWNTEGTFYFPLPPDASVSRLAMYVAGQLNEGGMVSRQRGQEIYTEILHQRRDPALLEMMEGNMFKMRIFPLEGRQEKRIFLSYTQNLDELYGTIRYWLPMDHTQDIANQFEICIRIKDGAKQFDPGCSTHDVQLATDGDDLLLDYSAKKIKPDQDFLLNLVPKKDFAHKEVRVMTCEQDGQTFLSAKLVPDLTGEHQPEPRQWIVVSDVSASRSRTDVLAQRHVLERLITEADDDDTVFLMDLGTKARNISVRPVNVRSEEVKPLLNHRPQRLIGATNIAAGLDTVQEVIRKHDLKNPYLVYLGDGVATDGEKAITELPRLIPSGCRFVGIGIGKQVDSMFLQEAASRTGGLFTTINPNEDIDWRVFDLIASLNTARMTNIRVALLDENDKPMEAIAYPSATIIAAGEILTVTAMCGTKLPSWIRFTGQVDGRSVTKTAMVQGSTTGAAYLPRLWAKQHINNLLKSDMANQEEIIALSKAFYVVTPFTSLIVLEDDAMYAQYDVGRGRKDHWAMYDAPQTIEVIKEPVDWNRWEWGWRQFEGEDSKFDAKTQPQTIQEIVDGIQLRINAPFYLWPDSPQDSRIGLYQICDSELTSDPTRLLALWFLLASGQRQSAIDWSRNTPAEKDDGSTGQPGALDSPWFDLGQRLSGEKAIQPELSLDSKLALVDGKFRQLQPMAFVRNSIRAGHFFANPPQSSLMPSTATIGQGALFADEIAPLSEFLQIASMVPGSSGLTPKLSAIFNRAVSTRWSRVQRDIDKYNSRFGGNWNGTWNQNGWYAWNESIDLAGNRLTTSLENDLQDLNAILEDFRRVERKSLANLGSSVPFSDHLLELDFENSNEFEFTPMQQIISSFEPGNLEKLVNRHSVMGGVGPLAIDGGLDLYSTLRLNGYSRSISQPFLPPRTSTRVPRPVFLQQTKSLPASIFLTASQFPSQTQPGMASVLAADYLHKRLVQLNSETVLDQRKLAEKTAIETAISTMERVGASLESSAMFWGYAGWSYQPRPQMLQPPTIQAYPGYAWSFDLTRYAGGLYSNGTDMVHEVTRQYGKSQPLGKIDDATRKLIGDSRSNFQPVSLRFADEGIELYVGPNDRFAMTHRNDMYLTEKLICDGTQILQIYDELGISARREASEIRLNELRQRVPHMISPADSLIGYCDVELVERDDNSYRLKLTLAKTSPTGDESVDDDDDQNHPAETNPKETSNPERYFLVTVDHQGRILNRQWIVGDETVLSLSFKYDGGQVELAWDLKINTDSHTGITSYQAKPFTPRDETFTANLDRLVVLDMPLMKPSFYAQKLAELSGSRATANPEVDAEPTKPDRRISLEHGEAAVRLLRHQILASIQDLDGNRWGQGNATAMATTTELFKLLERLGQTPRPGDVTLCGSSGVQISQSPEIRDRLNKYESIRNSALFRFYGNRYDWQEQARQSKAETGLIGHIAAYNAATYGGQDPQFEFFASHFGDSPLRLALACSYHQGFKLDRLLELNDDPRWSGIALLVASARCSSPDDNQKLAIAFWKWQEELAKKDQQPVLSASVLRLIKSVDQQNQDKVSKLLTQQFELVRKLDSLPVLLNFAERISSWDEVELADAAYALARTKLGLDNAKSDDCLLRRFAYGQSLWAGNRYKSALEQFDVILKSLQEKQIPVSPSFCAAMARLAGQAGNAEKCVQLEERALELEQPYLPDAINLSAFRQRYQWLWSQYVNTINGIAPSDPERSLKIETLLARATRTWDRWRDVDRDNAALPEQMATLLKLAGREEEAWEFLSSIIDQRPRDSVSYFQVGQWYRQQRDLGQAVRWLGEAPQWDTANPQWLFHYGSVLKELGRKTEADVQFNKIINGNWAPGLQNWVDQARNEL